MEGRITAIFLAKILTALPQEPTISDMDTSDTVSTIFFTATTSDMDTSDTVSTTSSVYDYSDLDLPFQSSTVTVRKMAKGSNDGQVVILYHLVAGILSHNINEIDGDFSVTTEKISNDDLYNAIQSQSVKDLDAAGLETDKKEKMLSENPKFVVTSTMPLYNRDGVLYFNSIKPTVEQEEESEVYTYIHPRDPEFMISVEEPSSPSKVKLKFDGGKVVTTTLTECDKEKYHRMKTKLLAGQQKLLADITQAYILPSCKNENSTISIILSVIKTQESDVHNIALAFKGIIMPALPDKAPYHEDISDNYGWIASLHWIKSPKLAEHLACAQSYNFQLHDHANNHVNCRLSAIINPKISLSGTTVPLGCQSGNDSVGFEIETDVGKVRVSAGKTTIQVAVLTTMNGPESTVTLEAGYHYHAEELHQSPIDSVPLVSMDKLIKELELDQRDVNAAGIPSGDTPVHVGLIEAQTLLKKGKDGKLQVAKSPQVASVVMIAMGMSPEIELPGSFAYQDALNRWTYTSKTIHEDIDVLSNLVSHYWGSKISFEGKGIAEHVLLMYGPTTGGSFRRLDHKISSRNPDTLHLPDKESKSLIFDVKSHNAQPKSLENHLKANHNFLKRFQTILASNPQLSLPDIAEHLEFGSLYEELCGNLPTSYQYPTVGIMNKVLAKPNHLSANGHLAHSHENCSHIRFSQPGLSAAVPTRLDVANIMKAIVEKSGDML